MDKSPLSRLPAEVTNKIYRHVLIAPRGIRLQVVKRDQPGYEDAYLENPSGQAIMEILALTMTCKLLRGLTIPVFFGANIFHLDDTVQFHEYMVWAIEHWLEALGDTAYHLRHVRISPQECGPDELYGYEEDLQVYHDVFHRFGVHVTISFHILLYAGSSVRTMGPFLVSFNNLDIDTLRFALDTALERQKVQIEVWPARYASLPPLTSEDLDEAEADLDEMVEGLRELRRTGKTRSGTPIKFAKAISE